MQRHRRAVIGVTTAIVVLGAGTSAWALTGSSAAAYRTADVTRGTVTQALTTTGTITPMRSADLDFQVAGTVAKVLVKQGDRVKVGQRLAILDRVALRAAVHAAQASLDQARATLVNDEDSQASAASSLGSSNTPTTPTPRQSATPKASPTPTQSDSPVSKALLAKIRSDQNTLIKAQQQTDADLATAKAALKTVTQACASEVTPSSGDTNDTNDTNDDTAACVAATKASLADQQTVAADLATVAAVETALTRDLSTALDASTPSSPTTATDTVWNGNSSSAVHAIDAVATTTTAAITTDAPTGTTVTAATLARDQSAIDADRATVASAKADLLQATLRSTISGKVAAVTIAKGDQVSGSASAGNPAVKIVGSRQSKVTISVTAAQVRQLKVGMTATVTPDGASAPLHAILASIGEATTDSTSGDTTYPVTLSLTAKPTGLVSGAAAQVSVVLSRLANVIVVPTSAVHHSGTKAYVETYVASRVSRRTVTVGAVGADVTQVHSGLSVGQHVVLANLNAAVPSSSTNLLNSNSRSGPTTFTRGGTGGPPSFSGPPGATVVGR